MTKSLVIDGLSTIDLSTFNEDWLNWSNARGVGDPGWAEQIKYENACMGLTPEGFDYEPCGEDVDFAQAQIVAECAEASWHRFCINGR